MTILVWIYILWMLFLFCFSLKTTAKCFECQILTCSVDLLLPLSWDCGCWRWAFLSFIICYRWKLLRNVYIYRGKNVNDWNSMILKWKCTFIDLPSSFSDLDQIALWLLSSEVVHSRRTGWMYSCILAHIAVNWFAQMVSASVLWEYLVKVWSICV